MPYVKERTSHDRVERKRFIRRKKYVAPEAPKECYLVESNGRSRIFFTSVKKAKRALAALVALLPKRKSKDEPKRFVIEK